MKEPFAAAFRLKAASPPSVQEMATPTALCCTESWPVRCAMLCELLVDGLDGEHDNPAYGEHRHDPDDPKMAEIQVKEACQQAREAKVEACDR